MAKQFKSMKFGIEEMKNVIVCDMFYHVAFDTIGPVLETTIGNKYVLMASDHYSKWCEVQLVKEHDVFTVSNFLEDEMICRYGVPKYILTNNGIKWMK
jgi:hypothetical protein